VALLEILHYPDPRLRKKALAVTHFDEALRKLVADMLETMYRAPGIGLAAPQINVAQRVVVIDISRENNTPRVFINPEIIESRGKDTMEEGCLSVPDTYDTVERAAWIRVKAMNANGESFELECEGLLAVCVQHELDHLDGKLFVDRLSMLKRSRIRRKFEKAQRLAL
jgi:peptide deformylase